MQNKKAIALSVLLSLSASSLMAQVSNTTEPSSGRINSPYSRFGVGLLSENKSIGLRGMGGTATGYSSEHVVNAYNPASYSYLSATAFELGFIGTSNSAKMGTDITKSSTITLSHLNLAFPVIKQKLALNIGYKPISNVYYKSQDSAFVSGLGQTVKTQNGAGGLNYGFLGISGGTGGFSVGVNAGYLFGSIRNSSYFNVVDTDYYHLRVSDFTNKDQYGGLYFETGLMYRAKIKKTNYLSIGLTSTLNQKLNASRTHWEVAGTESIGGSVIVTDTVAASYGQKDKMTLPSQFSGGIHYGKNNVWDVGVDLTYANWNSFSRFGTETPLGVGQNAYRFAIGGEVLPNPKATGKEYFSAVTYRLGAYYGKDYFNLNATDIKYFGGTFGLQLPFKPSAGSEQMGSLNLALDMGNRGTLDNGLAKEFYTKFTIGLKLNAHWFVRRKYD